jgi:hypothetical protein
MTNNEMPQLPPDVVEQIKTNAALRAYHNEGKDNSSFANGYYSGYITGATTYAAKLQEAKQELKEAQDAALMFCNKHNELATKHVESIDLLTEVFQKHESGLLPDRFIYEKIKCFLYGEK